MSYKFTKKKLIGLIILLVLVMACVFTKKKSVYQVFDEDNRPWQMTVVRPLWSKYSNKVIFTSGDDKFIMDFKGKYEHNIYKIQTGRVNDETNFDIAFGVYNKAPSHQVYAKRMFIYYIDDGILRPKFRCSRFIRPMVDFAMADLDGDGFDEIYTIEKYKNQYSLNMYRQYDLKIELISSFDLDFKADSFLIDQGLFIVGDQTHQVYLKNEEVSIYED